MPIINGFGTPESGLFTSWSNVVVNEIYMLSKGNDPHCEGKPIKLCTGLIIFLIMVKFVPAAVCSVFFPFFHRHIDQKQEGYVKLLAEAVAIKSVSGWPEARPEVLQMVNWVKEVRRSKYTKYGVAGCTHMNT